MRPASIGVGLALELATLFSALGVRHDDEALALAGIVALAGARGGLAGALALAAVDAETFTSVAALGKCGRGKRAGHQQRSSGKGNRGARFLSQSSSVLSYV